MFVGEAPGRDEDIEGLPFVGRSGKLLDRMIAAIGLDRSKRLHRQRDSLAAARQPHADAAGDADLPAVHPAPDRTGQPGRAGDARQSLDADAAVDPRGHHEDPRQLVRLRHRHAHDPRASRRSIRPICCARRPTSGWRGWICARSRRRWSRRSRRHPEVLAASASARRISRKRMPAASFERAQERAPQDDGPSTAPSAARWPSRSATAAGGRSPAIRTRAALPAPGRETAARSRAAACLTVSEARQTTTPPVSLNFASDSHGVRSGVASSNRCGRPAGQRDQARQLRIAGHRAQPLVGAPLETVAEEMRDGASPAATSALRRCRSTAGTASPRSPPARAR